MRTIRVPARPQLGKGTDSEVGAKREAPFYRGRPILSRNDSRSPFLVPPAAEWGHSRRSGRLHNLHLGARDPHSGQFVMLGKTFKGLTDEMLHWQTEKLLALETSRDEWTVYVKPELVVEIVFGEIRESPRYPAGLALRFARVKRYRPDKSTAEADTIQTVTALFHKQRGEGEWAAEIQSAPNKTWRAPAM